MIDADTQKKLDRLAAIEAGNRARSIKYLEKVKAAGRKQVSAILSPEAYAELTRRQEASTLAGKPLSFGAIIGAALLKDSNHNIKAKGNVNESVNKNVNIDKDVKPNEAKDLNSLLLSMDGTYKEKADKLNTQGALTPKGRKWTADNLRMAVNRLKKDRDKK